MAELFRTRDLNTFLLSQKSEMEKYVETLRPEIFASNSLDDLVENCYNKFCVEPVEILNEDQQNRRFENCMLNHKYQDPYSYQVRTMPVNGFIAEFYFPFIGDSDLFKYSASKYYLSPYPDAKVQGQFLVFTYQEELKESSDGQTESAAILKRLESDRKVITEVLSWSNSDVANFNNNLRNDITNKIIKKKAQSDSFFSIQKLLEIPLTKTEYAIKHVPLVRRDIPLKTHSYNTEPSYVISTSDFNFIWDIIVHNCATYERTPRSFVSLGEEDLRNTLLASLNGYFKGNAAGEAFRNKGKTDICIEQENRSAFIAECKMWTGAAAVHKAVEQLLGYTTWRDCKCSIIFFCRRIDFLKCCDAAKEAIQKIPGTNSHLSIKPEEISFSISRSSDSRDHVKIHVLIVNLYSDKMPAAT